MFPSSAAKRFPDCLFKNHVSKRARPVVYFPYAPVSYKSVIGAAAAAYGKGFAFVTFRHIERRPFAPLYENFAFVGLCFFVINAPAEVFLVSEEGVAHADFSLGGEHNLPAASGTNSKVSRIRC